MHYQQESRKHLLVSHFVSDRISGSDSIIFIHVTTPGRFAHAPNMSHPQSSARRILSSANIFPATKPQKKNYINKKKNRPGEQNGHIVVMGMIVVLGVLFFLPFAKVSQSYISVGTNVKLGIFWPIFQNNNFNDCYVNKISDAGVLIKRRHLKIVDPR